jgi:hypothetical protein
MIYKTYRDIANFLTVRKAIKKAEKTGQWRKFNLRRDWVYRVYTVLNPTKYERGDDKMVLKQKMLEKTYPINDYINTLGLSDIVAASWEEIPETDSYLLVYYPIFNYLTTWRVLVFSTLFLIGTILTLMYFL